MASRCVRVQCGASADYEEIRPIVLYDDEAGLERVQSVSTRYLPVEGNRRKRSADVSDLHEGLLDGRGKKKEISFLDDL